jgi:large subunit ribosomal protein L9
MQLILKEDVHNLGKSGDLVTVREGYGRNYLLPQGKGVLATAKNVTEIEHQKKVIAARNAKLLKDSQAMADKIAQVEVYVERQAGTEDKLFGAVTARDIEEAFADKGIKLDRKKIKLDEPIKSLGVYTIEAKLATDVTTKFKLWVVRPAPTA